MKSSKRWSITFTPSPEARCCLRKLAGFLAYSVLDGLPIHRLADSDVRISKTLKSLQLRVQPRIYTGFPFIAWGVPPAITKNSPQM